MTTDTIERTTLSTLSTLETVDVLGVSYRQVDYLTRTGRVPVTGRGSGSRTRWPLDVVRRLHLATRLLDAIGDRDIEGGYSRFPAVVEAVMRGDEHVPAVGFVVLSFGQVRYVTTVEQLVAAVRLGGAVAASLVGIAEHFEQCIADLLVDREAELAQRYQRSAQPLTCERCAYRCATHRPGGGWA